jgi:hypothetical protein
MCKGIATLVDRVLAIIERILAGSPKLVIARDRYARRSPRSLKTHLAAAPLEGIELDRARDFGRDLDL